MCGARGATLPVFTQPACTLPLTDFDSAAFLSILLNYTVLTYLFALYCVQNADGSPTTLNYRCN